MNAADIAAYREKLKRERKTWLAFSIGWGCLTIIVGVLYKLFFDIDSLWVIITCNMVPSQQVLSNKKIGCVQFSKLMQDDAALKARWNEDHDERMLMIMMHAGMPFMDYLNIMLNVAALVAMPLSMAVAITLLAVSYVQQLASLWAMSYWKAKLSGEESSEEDE